MNLMVKDLTIDTDNKRHPVYEKTALETGFL